jgi:hypothetical protein
MWKKLSKMGEVLLIGLASLVFLLLIFSFVPIMRVSYAVEEMYSVTETYYVQETYTVEEPYTVMEPYTAIEIYCAEEPCLQYIPIDYLVIRGEGYNYFQADGSPACGVEVLIENDDVIGGVFTAEFVITLQGDLTTTISGSKYIEAGDTQKVKAYYNAPLKTLHSFTYSITAPTKLNPTYTEVEVTKYQPVIKYGEVTKERYVPQEVEVLETRTVINYKRVSLLDYLINY